MISLPLLSRSLLPIDILAVCALLLRPLGPEVVVHQILLAAGEALPFSQERASEIRCHAIEHRLNAEDPEHGFAPRPGRITGLRLPGGPGVRMDTHIYAGYNVPMYYDSLLGKLIVWSSGGGTAPPLTFPWVGPAGFTDKVMAQIPEIALDIDLPGIFKNKIYFKKLTLDVGEVNVVLNEQGKLNVNSLALLLPPKGTGTPPEVKIDELVVKVTKVGYW